MEEKKHYCGSCIDGCDGNDEGIEPEISMDGKIHTVHNPEDGKIIYRGYLCEEHYDMYLTDGYRIN